MSARERTLRALKHEASSRGVSPVKGHRGHKQTWIDAIAASKRRAGPRGAEWLPRLVPFRAVKVPTLRVTDILTGYRHEPTAWQCARSLFMLHNETLNIWTHLISIAFYVAMLARLYAAPDEIFGRAITINERRIFTLHCVGNCAVFLGSALYHTFCSLGAQARDTLLLFDIAGISWMISAEFTSLLLLIFVCAPKLRLVYCVVVGGPLLAMVAAPLYSKLVRNALLVLTSAFSLVPMVHFTSMLSVEAQSCFVKPMVGGLICYGIGFVIFQARLPERFAPGRFDTFGMSHTIWHCFIFGASLSMHSTIVRMLREPALFNRVC